MIILGLTGSIGMGKSTTADLFREQNIRVYDADEAVHQLYQKEAVEPIRHLFPQAIVNDSVNRQRLSELVLGNDKNMKNLENLIHPMVWRKEQEFLQQAKSAEEFIVVLDIPLLFETKGEKRVDLILVVSASEQQQRQRVLSREGMSEEKFNAILKRQIPDREKRQRADFVIDTGKGMANARKRVKEIIEECRSLPSPKPKLMD